MLEDCGRTVPESTVSSIRQQCGTAQDCKLFLILVIIFLAVSCIVQRVPQVVLHCVSGRLKPLLSTVRMYVLSSYLHTYIYADNMYILVDIKVHIYNYFIYIIILNIDEKN